MTLVLGSEVAMTRRAMSDQGIGSGEIQVGTTTHSTTLMLYADMVVVGGGVGQRERTRGRSDGVDSIERLV